MRQPAIATVAIAALATLSAGCSALGFHRKSASLHDRVTQEASYVGDATEPQFDSWAIESIADSRPQLELHVHVAVSQPVNGKPWTQKEIDEIASWESALRRAGIASELTVLPAGMVCNVAETWHPARCPLDGQRAAAARIGAEALLLMDAETETNDTSNALAALDLTIIGMWVFPAHTRHARTMVEGTLMDNRNRYIYAFARGEAEKKARRPLMYTDQSGVEQASRREAILAFGSNFIAEAKQIEVE
jgi:hypothetical protein